MNNKVLVEIKVPATGETYDVFIPLDSVMSEVSALVSASLAELSQGKYKATAVSVLLDAESGTIFRSDMMVEELGIKNGSRLVLV